MIDSGKLVAVTYGADGAVLYEHGKQVAGSASPMIIPGRDRAGDAFTACLLVRLLEGRPYEEALRRACIAGAYAAAILGGQSPPLPSTAHVEAWLK